MYSLPTVGNVKNTRGEAGGTRRRGRRSGAGSTRVSSKHQVTIPAEAFRGAGLQAGDTLRAEALGAGRVVFTRLDELVDRYSGALDAERRLRDDVETVRDEWR